MWFPKRDFEAHFIKMSIEDENATKISPENYWVYECRVIDEVVCDSHNQKEMLCARSMIGLIMPSIFSVSRKFADRYPGYTVVKASSSLIQNQKQLFSTESLISSFFPQPAT